MTKRHKIGASFYATGILKINGVVPDLTGVTTLAQIRRDNQYHTMVHEFESLFIDQLTGVFYISADASEAARKNNQLGLIHRPARNQVLV